MNCNVTPLRKYAEISYRVKCVSVENERVFGDVYVTQQTRNLLYCADGYQFPTLYERRRSNLIHRNWQGPDFMEINKNKPIRRASCVEVLNSVKKKRELRRSKSVNDTGNVIERCGVVDVEKDVDSWKPKIYPAPLPNPQKKEEPVTSLVDRLLLDIYGLPEGDRRRSESDSTASSLRTRPQHQHLQKARLLWKSKHELEVLILNLRDHINHTGGILVRQLRRKDYLTTKRDKLCGIITAHLQAASLKRVEDTKMRFSLTPQPGESGFIQWLDAMKMVARLPGGIPPEFRRKLWLTLAERHLDQRGVDWKQAEKICFNEWSNPDDEELGIQIVKDLHRTGCSLFCGAAGRDNQAVLRRVLLGFARWNKSVGYCQGLNVLAALVLQVMDRAESAAVKVMIYLIEGVLPEGYFADNLRGLSVDMAVFRDLLRARLPKLSKHLEALQNDAKDKATGSSYEPPLTNVFTMQWFLTLFCHCLPQEAVLRVWDLIFLEGDEILLRTALAIWEGLSDRIMTVTSADEFYSIMGVLTREMLEFTDTNNLIKNIVSMGPLHGVTGLREKHRYNITPWARKLSDDDDSDTEEDERLAVAAAMFSMAQRLKKDRLPQTLGALQAMAPGSDRERLALDISTLKQQYAKLRERQRQAHIILSAACARQTMVPPPASQAMNHLLVGKNALVSGKNRPLSLPSAPAAQAKTRPAALNQNRRDRQAVVTLHWKDTKKAKQKAITASGVAEATVAAIQPSEAELSSPKYSNGDSDSDSTSTELCDEPDRLSDVDSEDLTSASDSYVAGKDEERPGSPEKSLDPSLPEKKNEPTDLEVAKTNEESLNDMSIAKITDQIRRLSAEDDNNSMVPRKFSMEKRESDDSSKGLERESLDFSLDYTSDSATVKKSLALDEYDYLSYGSDKASVFSSKEDEVLVHERHRSKYMTEEISPLEENVTTSVTMLQPSVTMLQPSVTTLDVTPEEITSIDITSKDESVKPEPPIYSNFSISFDKYEKPIDIDKLYDLDSKTEPIDRFKYDFSSLSLDKPYESSNLSDLTTEASDTVNTDSMIYGKTYLGHLPISPVTIDRTLSITPTIHGSSISEGLKSDPIIEKMYKTDPIEKTYKTDPIEKTYKSEPPIEKTYKSDPIEKTYKSDPIEKTYKTDPIEKTYKSDPPIEKTYKSDPPIEKTYKSDPIEKTYKADSIEKTYKSDPIEKTYKSDPPIENTYKSDPPIEKTYKSDPIEKTYKSDPIEKTYKTDPIEKTYKSDPIEKTYKSDPPIEITYKSDPIEKPYKPDPIEKTYKPDILLETYKSEPLEKPYIYPEKLQTKLFSDLKSPKTPESTKSFGSGETMGPDSKPSSLTVSPRTPVRSESRDFSLDKSGCSSISSDSKTLVRSTESNTTKDSAKNGRRMYETSDTATPISLDSLKNKSDVSPKLVVSSSSDSCSPGKLKSSERSFSSDLQSPISANSIKFTSNLNRRGQDDVSGSSMDLSSATSPFYPIANPNLKTPTSPYSASRRKSSLDSTETSPEQKSTSSRESNKYINYQKFDSTLKTSDVQEMDRKDDIIKPEFTIRREDSMSLRNGGDVSFYQSSNEYVFDDGGDDPLSEKDVVPSLPQEKLDKHYLNYRYRDRSKLLERSSSSLDSRRHADLKSSCSTDEFATSIVKKRSSDILEDIKHLEAKANDGSSDSGMLTKKSSYIWEDMKSLEARRQDTFSNSASTFSKHRLEIPNISVTGENRSYVVYPKINIDENSDSILKTVACSKSDDDDDGRESKLGVWTKVKPRKKSDNGRRNSDRALKIIQENSAILQKILACQAKKRLPDLEEISKEITISPINEEISKIFSPILEKMGLNEHEINEELARINFKDFDSMTATSVSEFDAKINEELSKLSLIDETEQMDQLDVEDVISHEYLDTREALIDRKINEELSKLLANYEDSPVILDKRPPSQNVSEIDGLDVSSISTNVFSYKSSNDSIDTRSDSTQEPIPDKFPKYTENLPYVRKYVDDSPKSDIDIYRELDKLDKISSAQILPEDPVLQLPQKELSSIPYAKVTSPFKDAPLRYTSKPIQYDTSPLKSSYETYKSFEYKPKLSPKQAPNPFTSYEKPDTFEYINHKSEMYDLHLKSPMLAKESLEFRVRYDEDPTREDTDYMLPTERTNKSPYYSNGNEHPLTPTKYQKEDRCLNAAGSFLESSELLHRKYEALSPKDYSHGKDYERHLAMLPLETIPDSGSYLTRHREYPLSPNRQFPDQPSIINHYVAKLSPGVSEDSKRPVSHPEFPGKVTIGKYTELPERGSGSYKKSSLSLGNIGKGESNYSVTSPKTQFSPFPVRNAPRKPKELTLKLGLYSPNSPDVGQLKRS